MWPPTITPCECTHPGWCERHRCWKPSAFHLLCRRRVEYYQAWEEGRGPCLPVPGSTPTPAEPDPSAEATNGDAAPAPPSSPGLIQRALNFGSAVVRHVADGVQTVAPEIYEARLAVCRACSMCDTARMVCQHQSCGCFLAVKAQWQSEDCPLHQWPQPHSESCTTP